MPRRQSQFLQITGPVFDDNMERKVKDTIAKGIENAGDEAAGILMGFISQAGFVDTGAFLQSVDSQFKRERGVGYAVITAQDQWPKRGRPTKTWAEKGTRGGKKLRPAKGMFSKTGTRVKAFTYDRLESDLARVLN